MGSIPPIHQRPSPRTLTTTRHGQHILLLGVILINFATLLSYDEWAFTPSHPFTTHLLYSSLSSHAGTRYTFFNFLHIYASHLLHFKFGSFVVLSYSSSIYIDTFITEHQHSSVSYYTTFLDSNLIFYLELTLIVSVKYIHPPATPMISSGSTCISQAHVDLSIIKHLSYPCRMEHPARDLDLISNIHIAVSRP